MVDFRPVSNNQEVKTQIDFKPIASKPSMPDVAKAAAKEVYKRTFGVRDNAVLNAPGNALETGKSLFNAAVDAEGTVNALKDVAVGGAQKLVPGQQSSEPSFDAFWTSLKQKYNSPENFLNTIQKKPVEFLADASTLLSGAGGLTKAAGGLARAGGLTEVAEGLGNIGSKVGTVGAAAEPIGMATKLAKEGTRLTGDVAAEGLGITTGAGGAAVKEAFTNSNPALRAAMRGQTAEANIIDDAKSALNNIKESRRAEYQQQLPKAISNPVKFDAEMGQLKADLNNKISEFKIGVKEDGSLDFSRSPVSKESQGIIEEAVNRVRDWGSRPGDFSVEGLDTLKRQLEDMMPKTGAAQAFVASLKSRVRNTLVKSVPDYAKLVGDYEEASNIIKDIEGGLSLTGRAGSETVMRKLNQALKQNFEFRKTMVDKLDQASNGKIVSQLAGNQLSSLAPRGLARVGAEIGGAALGVGAAKGLISPRYLAALALSSPRLVGETLSLLGIPSMAIGRVLNSITTKTPTALRQVGIQASNIKKSQKATE